MRDRNHKAKNARHELLVHGVPPDLRAALTEQAKSQGVSVNEAAVILLSQCFKVKHVPVENGLKGATGPTHSFPRGDSDILYLRGGAKLQKAITADARKRGGTLRGVVLECLCLHFDIEPEPIGRRPRQPKGTTA
jgi:hypothetical protein